MTAAGLAILALLASGDAPTLPPTEEELRAAVLRNPLDPAPRRALASRLEAKGRPLEAFAVLRPVAIGENALASDRWRAGLLEEQAGWEASDEVLASLSRANGLVAAGDTVTVTPLLKSLVREAPKLGAPHYHLGWLSYRKGDLAGAEKEYRLAAKLHGNEPHHRALVHLDLAAVLLDRDGRTTPEQLALLEQAQADDPLVGAINLALMRACLASSRLECARSRAIPLIEEDLAFEIAEKPAAAREEAWEVATALGCRPAEDMDRPFRKGACVPVGVVERCWEGARRLREGEVDQARAELEAALAVEPYFPACQLNLADALTLAGDTLGAARAYDRALLGSRWSLAPQRRADAMLGRARALVERRLDPAEAARLAHEAGLRGRTPAARAEASWLEAKGFALSGNSPCAAELLRDLSDDTELAEAFRVRAREALAEIHARTREPGRCFPYELYRYTTISLQLDARFRENGLVRKDSDVFFPVERYRITDATFTGARRRAPEDRRAFMVTWLGQPEPSAVPSEELELSSGGRTFWVFVDADMLARSDGWLFPGKRFEVLLDVSGFAHGVLVLRLAGVAKPR